MVFGVSSIGSPGETGNDGDERRGRQTAVSTLALELCGVKVVQVHDSCASATVLCAITTKHGKNRAYGTAYDEAPGIKRLLTQQVLCSIPSRPETSYSFS